MINHIQNKSFCFHNICVYTVCIYYVYINTHACICLRKICYVCTFKIFIYNISYININIYMEIFSKYILYVCVFIYIVNIHSIHILCKPKLFLYTINRLTALNTIIIYFFLLFLVSIAANHFSLIVQGLVGNNIS